MAPSRSDRALYGALLTEHQVETALESLCALPRPDMSGKRAKLPHERFRHIETYLRSLDQRFQRRNQAVWWPRPRIYTVLRSIGALAYMDEFIEHGFNDISLPFTMNTLPDFLTDDASRERFLNHQQSVLTDARMLEESATTHMHFDDSADEHMMLYGTLGHGGFGYVDAVLSKLSLRLFARKRVHRGKDSEANRRIQRYIVEELTLMKTFSHRHLTKIVGSYTDPQYIAYLMEPVADCNLLHFLTRRDRMTTTELTYLRHFYGCLAGAVHYLHTNKVRHRDLKPQNILVKKHQVYIADFGTALEWTTSKRGTTQDRNAPATLDYMAPEVDDRSSRNAASDMWSLGIVFLDMLTVLKGVKLSKWKEHLNKKAQNARTDPYPCRNMPAVNEWLTNLQNRGALEDLDNEPLMWVKLLLQMKPEHRPNSQTLVRTITESPFFRDFTCFECIGEFGEQSYFYQDHVNVAGSTHSRDREVYEDDLSALIGITEQSERLLSDERSQSIKHWLDTQEQHPSFVTAELNPPKVMEQTIQLAPATATISSDPVTTMLDDQAAQTASKTSPKKRLHEHGFFIQDDSDSSHGEPSEDETPINTSPFFVVEDSSDESSVDLHDLDRVDSPMQDDEHCLPTISEEQNEEGADAGQCLELTPKKTTTVRFDNKATIRYAFVDEDDAPQTVELGRKERALPAHGPILEIIERAEPTKVSPGLNRDSSDADAIVPRSFGQLTRNAQRKADGNMTTDRNGPLSQDIPKKSSVKKWLDSKASCIPSFKPSENSNTTSKAPVLLPWHDITDEVDLGSSENFQQRDPPSALTGRKSLSASSAEPTNAIPKADIDKGKTLAPGIVPSTHHSGLLELFSLSAKEQKPSSLHIPKRLKATSLSLPAPPPDASSQSLLEQLQIQSPRSPIATSQVQNHYHTPDLPLPLNLQKNHTQNAEHPFPPDVLTIAPKTKSRLSTKNVSKLNEATQAPKKNERRSFNRDDFSPVKYLEDAWNEMEAAESLATSVMSEKTARKVRGISKKLDHDYSFMENYCKEGQAAPVKALLEKGCNPGKTSKPRPKPLLLAIKGASAKHNKCVKALIASNCDVNARWRSRTPIHWAIERPYFKGYGKLLGMLLGAGAKMDECDGDGDYPLLKLFAGATSMELEDYRIEALALVLHPKVPTHVNVNVRQPVTLNTALHLAIKRRTPVAVAVLIHRGADVNLKNASGTTPLLMTANAWRLKLTLDQELTLGYLLGAKDLEIDVKGGSLGRTALHNAASAKCLLAIEMLVERGASKEEVDKNGSNALAILEGGGQGDVPLEEWEEIRALLKT